MPYTTRENVEQVYGASNVSSWANLDNDDIDLPATLTAITARIDFFLAEADMEIDSFLRGGPYEVPFTATFPPEIVSIASRIAGYRIYEARGITDNNPANNELLNHKTYFEERLQGIQSGKIRLDIDRFDSVPEVVISD